MNSKTTTTSRLNRILLTAFAIVGIFLLAFYFMAEIEDPEYLVFFAPILGLAFYGSYFIVNHYLNNGLLEEAYNQDSQPS